MNANGEVTVATSGQTVERNDRCVQCDSPMLYNVRDGVVRFSFCPNYHCGLWCSAVFDAAARPEGEGRGEG